MFERRLTALAISGLRKRPAGANRRACFLTILGFGSFLTTIGLGSDAKRVATLLEQCDEVHRGGYRPSSWYV